ncbi:MAG: GAF domain-containing protein [Rhodobacteraceae bacterium]|nr:GAF domain-containing protein [Paracoccaceae bacterium]
MDPFAEFSAALAEETGQPERSFAALERLAEACVGIRLFTLMRFDTDSGEGERIYTNRPEIYPVTGRKPIPEGIWSETLFARREIFVANSIEEIAAVFPDHEIIRSLNCGAVLNIPAIAGDQLLGCANCLDSEGAYNAERQLKARRLAQPAAECLLLERRFSNSGGHSWDKQ